MQTLFLLAARGFPFSRPKQLVKSPLAMPSENMLADPTRKVTTEISYAQTYGRGVKAPEKAPSTDFRA
jgi:hypothetical protein